VFNLQKTNSEKSIAASQSYVIRIYNDFGLLVYSSKESGFQFTIPIDNLPIGNYIVEINDGVSTEKQKLIISR